MGPESEPLEDLAPGGNPLFPAAAKDGHRTEGRSLSSRDKDECQPSFNGTQKFSPGCDCPVPLSTRGGSTVELVSLCPRSLATPRGSVILSRPAYEVGLLSRDQYARELFFLIGAFAMHEIWFYGLIGGERRYSTGICEDCQVGRHTIVP